MQAYVSYFSYYFKFKPKQRLQVMHRWNTTIILPLSYRVCSFSFYSNMLLLKANWSSKRPVEQGVNLCGSVLKGRSWVWAILFCSGWWAGVRLQSTKHCFGRHEQLIAAHAAVHSLVPAEMSLERVGIKGDGAENPERPQAVTYRWWWRNYGFTQSRGGGCSKKWDDA